MVGKVFCWDMLIKFIKLVVIEMVSVIVYESIYNYSCIYRIKIVYVWE